MRFTGQRSIAVITAFVVLVASTYCVCGATAAQPARQVATKHDCCKHAPVPQQSSKSSHQHCDHCDGTLVVTAPDNAATSSPATFDLLLDVVQVVVTHTNLHAIPQDRFDPFYTRPATTLLSLGCALNT